MSRFFLPNENTPTIGTCVDPCPHPYYGNEVTGLCTLCDQTQVPIVGVFSLGKKNLLMKQEVQYGKSIQVLQV
jgi:hypothetical protein